MKRIFKYIFILLIFVPFLKVNAVSSDDVYYNIKSLYMDVTIKNNGDVNVRELITLNGTFNGYERKILFDYEDKDNNLIINGLDLSLYKPSEIKNLKVGIIETGENPSFNIINNNVTYFNEGTGKNGDSNLYTITSKKNGASFKIYNETIESSTSFYISYTLDNLVVVHNDVAEILYPFLGDEFTDDIEHVEIHVTTPAVSETLRGYGHGPLYGIVKLKGHNSVVYEIDNLENNTPITGRVVFDKKLVSVSDDKLSGVDAEKSIISIEKEYEEERNKKIERIELTKKIIKVFVYVFYFIVAGFAIYVYMKFDKEYNSRFKEKYNRNFTGNYGVETVEYIMNKNVTQDSFNASLLNLIYKKKIKIEKIDALSKFSKDDYKFIRVDTTNLTLGEEKIMSMLFAANTKEILLSEIQKNAKHTSLSGTNKFLKDYELWQKDAIKESEYYEFFEDSKIPLILGLILLGITILIAVFQIIYEVCLVSLIFEFILTIIIFVYFLLVKKRSKKGIEDYAKWKSFKRFLLDFGRMEEKDLPEVLIWDKYLVYATALGVAKKVSKAMKLKFETYGTAYTGHLSDTYNNYLLFNVISAEMNKSFALAHQEVAKMASSGAGAGGGFSGGGFSGGGGGSGF